MAGSKTDSDNFTVLHYVRITMRSTSHDGVRTQTPLNQNHVESFGTGAPNAHRV